MLPLNYLPIAEINFKLYKQIWFTSSNLFDLYVGRKVASSKKELCNIERKH